MNESPFKPIQEAHLKASQAYESLDSEITKQKVRRYLATDATILQAEVAINQQYLLALSDDRVAMERVKEGMAYWLQLVKRSMGL